MKVILHRPYVIILLLFLLGSKTYGATYDWVGTSLTAGVYNWNNKLNWQIGGVAAGSIPGASDIVRVAVLGYTNDPTITDAESCASVALGNYGNLTLTVNGALTVSGDISQANDPNFYQTTTLVGTGTIVCNNFNVGNTTAPNAGVGAVVTVSCQVKQLTVNGNIVLLAVGNSTGDGVEYPFFSLDANKLTLYGKISTVASNSPLSGGVDDPMYPGIGLFQTDSYSAATTLELLNNNAVVTPIVTGFTVDFTNNGSGVGTVLYDSPSGTQLIYTTATPGLGVVKYNYDYLTFAGASAKTVIGGAFTIGNDWTTGPGSLDLKTYSPTVTVGGNWINASTVTHAVGPITVSLGLQNTGTMTFGSAAVSIVGATTISSGATINTGTGLTTFGGAFKNGGTVIGSSGNIDFKGGYTNNSVFTQGAGSIYFGGTSQTIVDNTATGTIFKNVVFNCIGTVTMAPGVGNFTVASTGSITLTNPAKLIAGTATASYLTLTSDANSSATVNAISSTSSITGNVNVQRYVKGGSATLRTYRLLSSPVYAANVASNNVYSINYLKNSSYLTGSAGVSGGFDKTGNPTIYLFRENMAPSTSSFSAGNFRGIINISASPNYSTTDAGTFNIPVGNGFLFFFRGDRSTTLASKTVAPFVLPENTTLTATGTLNQGQITVHNWYTPASANLGYTSATSNASIRGYNLVGNPYASSIDWDLFNTTTPTLAIYGSGVSNMIYVYDPSSRNYGVYLKGVGTGTHNTSSTLPSGQGFFVITTSASSQLIFNESAKVNTQVSGINLLMGKPVDYANNQILRLQLVQDSVNNDDIIVLFNNNVSPVYNESFDAPYKPGYGNVSLASLSSDQVPLAISQQPLNKTSQTIGLMVNTVNDGSYQLNLTQLQAIPRLYDVWLMDAYKKDSLDMRANPSYTFSVLKSDTTSFGSKRFSIVLRQNPAFAYHLLNFAASKAPANPGSRAVLLVWKTENEQNYTHFTIERSIDNGETYQVLGGETANASGTYSIIDKDPRNQNFYRLKQEDINGSITYSKIVPIGYSDLSNNLNINAVNVYPNPASTVINLSLSPDVKAPSYLINITSSTGLVVKEFTSTQPSWQGSVKELMAGTYVVKVVNNKDQTLIGKTKFVKL